MDPAFFLSDILLHFKVESYLRVRWTAFQFVIPNACFPVENWAANKTADLRISEGVLLNLSHKKCIKQSPLSLT